MLDDFREQASQFIDEEPASKQAASTPTPYRTKFLGMTPVQTFIVAIMLLVITCLLSAFCLLVTGRIVPPGLY
jgi:hypothetical protein